jgi:hypothetical protein
MKQFTTIFVFSILTFQLFAQSVMIRGNGVPVVQSGEVLDMPWSGGINAPQPANLTIASDRRGVLIYDKASDNYQFYWREQAEWRMETYDHKMPDTKPGWSLLRDYNCDGKMDLFTTGNDGVEVYQNVGENEPEWELESASLRTLGSSGVINLIINSSDIPAIDDVDGDGDLDILVYNFAIGGFIRYHQNMSMEKYGHCDSLDYVFANRRWGSFEECDCKLYAFNGQTCSDISAGKVLHAGGKSLLALDVDDDGDVDLFGGQEDCPDLYFFENTGSVGNDFFGSYQTDFPDPPQEVQIDYLPAAYYTDLNLDGVPDLAVAPNLNTNEFNTLDFSQTLWLYENTATKDNPEFNFHSKNYLQNEMLDFGENSVPVVIDIDNDIDQDILVASNGFEKDGRYVGYITLLENTGNYFSPTFEVKDNNFLNIPAFSLINVQMDIIPESEGVAIFVTGWQADEGKSETHVFRKDLETGEWTDAFQESFSLPIRSLDAVEFWDSDQDGDYDLMVGKADGSLQYWQNDGDYLYTLISNAYLDIERDFTGTRLNLVPFITYWDEDNLRDVLLTDQRGEAYIILDFENSSGITPVTVQSCNSDLQKVFDVQSWLSVGTLEGGQRVIIAGGVRGGLQWLTPENGDSDEEKARLLVFPNPVLRNQKLRLLSDDIMQISLISMDGKIVMPHFKLPANEEMQLEVSHLSDGIYILRSEDSMGRRDSRRVLIKK